MFKLVSIVFVAIVAAIASYLWQSWAEELFVQLCSSSRFSQVIEQLPIPVNPCKVPNLIQNVRTFIL